MELIIHINPVWISTMVTHVQVDIWFMVKNHSFMELIIHINPVWISTMVTHVQVDLCFMVKKSFIYGINYSYQSCLNFDHGYTCISRPVILNDKFIHEINFWSQGLLPVFTIMLEFRPWLFLYKSIRGNEIPHL